MTARAALHRAAAPGLAGLAGTLLVLFAAPAAAQGLVVTVADTDGLGGSVEFAARGYESIRAGEQSIEGCPGERADQGTGLLLAVRLLP